MCRRASWDDRSTYYRLRSVNQSAKIEVPSFLFALAPIAALSVAEFEWNRCDRMCTEINRAPHSVTVIYKILCLFDDVCFGQKM